MSNLSILAAYGMFAIIARLQGITLNNNILFTSLSLLTLATTSPRAVLQAIPRLSSALESMRRIQAFLATKQKVDSRDIVSISDISGQKDDTKHDSQSSFQDTKTVISFENASLGWVESEPLLHDINYKVFRGGLHMIIGP